MKTKSPSFKLPTLAAFRRLSFKRKAKVFRDWAATKEGEYNSVCSLSCALSQFSVALGGDADVHGSSWSIYVGKDVIPVIEEDKDGRVGVIHAGNGGDVTTFPRLVKRLDTYIKKHY